MSVSTCTSRGWVHTNLHIAALRLHPVVPLTGRWYNNDSILPRGGGLDEASPLLVPQWTAVYLAFYPMHRRKDIFGKDADKFRPERWATLKPGWAFIPFGGGPRICIGGKYIRNHAVDRFVDEWLEHFAPAETTYTMLRILQTYEIPEAIDDKPRVDNIAITANSASGCKVYLQAASKA